MKGDQILLRITKKNMLLLLNEEIRYHINKTVKTPV